MEKIKELINNGTLTIDDVLEYARQYEQAADRYYEDEYNPDDYSFYQLCLEEQEAEKIKMVEDMYTDDYYNEPTYSMHSANPEYIVASTVRHLEETLIFESNKDGYITSYDDYSGIAERWTPGIDWTDSDLAVNTVFGTDVFERISDVMPTEKGYYVQYKRKQIN